MDCSPCAPESSRLSLSKLALLLLAVFVALIHCAGVFEIVAVQKIQILGSAEKPLGYRYVVENEEKNVLVLVLVLMLVDLK